MNYTLFEYTLLCVKRKATQGTVLNPRNGIMCYTVNTITSNGKFNG